MPHTMPPGAASHYGAFVVSRAATGEKATTLLLVFSRNPTCPSVEFRGGTSALQDQRLHMKLGSRYSSLDLVVRLLIYSENRLNVQVEVTTYICI